MTEKPIAIVTGVGPGTGAAIVKRFSAGGFRIIALARSTELINRLAQELPDVHAVTCDVSDESQVRAVVTDVKRRFGAAEVLIHNAVGGGWGSFREIDPKMLKGNFEVNVMGLLYLAREVASDMIDRGKGAILVTGNTSSIRGKANFAGFAPTKAAQRSRRNWPCLGSKTCFRSPGSRPCLDRSCQELLRAPGTTSPSR